MDAASDWMAIAGDNLEAAGHLRELGVWRPCASRSCFAVYAAVHAVVLHLGVTPPARGNWPHASLAETFFEAVRARLPGSRAAVAVHRVAVKDSYNLRLAADYGATAVVGHDAAWAAFRRAGQVVRFAREVVG